MEIHWLIVLVGVIVIALFAPIGELRGGSSCSFDDRHVCDLEDDDEAINRQWSRLPPRFKRIILRLFRVRLTGYDVKAKVAKELDLHVSSSDRRFVDAIVQFLVKNVGKGERIDSIINSEWRRTDPRTRGIVVRLFRLRWGNGVKIARQMIKKLKLDDPSTNAYDLAQKMFGLP
jgi:hypothetical protein